MGFAQQSGEPGDDLQQVGRNLRGEVRLLPDDADFRVQFARVVGADLRTETVLERGDDAPAVGVVLRVGAGDHQHVQRQPEV